MGNRSRGITVSLVIKYIKRTLAFFRLLDENGDLSITNICVILLLYRIMEMEALTVKEIVAFLSVVGTYQFKRYVQRKGKQ